MRNQPWNPAVLEQRIGRVHRLGQHRPVRVVSIVAQGGIEHGMLNLLAFKKSLFAGALEAGSDQILLVGHESSSHMQPPWPPPPSPPDAHPRPYALQRPSDR